MTYSSGGLIQSADYNGFVGPTASGGTANANINDIWGAGSGDKGYGQTAVSNSSVAGTITATQWASLVNTLTALGTQTNTTITARSAPTAGSTIGILSALNTDLAAVTTNRANAVGQGAQYATWTGTNYKSTIASGAAWTITFTNTVTFASAAAARYFFNGGGVIYLLNAKSSTGSTGDPPWNALATSIGTIAFSGIAASHTIAGTAYTGTTRIGGTGSPSSMNTLIGYYALTAGAASTIIYKQFSPTAPYTTDFIQISVALDATSSILTFTSLWSANDSGPGNPDPINTGTPTTNGSITPGSAPCCICYYKPPSSTYLTTASWGTPTIAATTA
jgi:hypothetical protein